MNRKFEPNVRPNNNLQSVITASRWTILGICLFLALIVWIVFGQTSRFGFIDYDDDVYVYKDPVIARGLTFEGLAVAFSFRHSDNWVPLTTLSHMLDCQFYGLNAGDHHLTNIVLQIAAAILLFLALRQMTGFLWRSAFVAAVFAIHPLRVESVAWVSERKDVLSGVFFMLTLWAYVRYVRNLQSSTPSGVRGRWFKEGSRLVGWYLATLFFFVLSLLSKPTVITLPCVLLLLDFWPLQRFNLPTLQCFKSYLVLEKIPFFILSVASFIPLLLVEKTGVQLLQFYPLYLRIENAIVSYVIQMERMVYPANLAVFYPYPNAIPWWEVALAGTLLTGICAIAWVQRHKRPWLLVGWLWYLGMLALNVGFIQMGAQAQADRYTYLPQIGLYLLLAWTAADFCALWRFRLVALGSCSTIILVALIFCARTQAGYWRNSEMLWTHAASCTSGNFLAHCKLGDELFQKGKLDEAISHFQIALQIKPEFALARYDLANLLLREGRGDEAISDFQQVLQSNPRYADAYVNLGNALHQQGRLDEAIANYQKALQINPNEPLADHNLGTALLEEGKADEAFPHFQKALQMEPDDATAISDMGNYYLQAGQTDTAIQYFQKALQIQPAFPMASYNLGNAYIQDRQMDLAIRWWQKAVELQPDFPMAHNNLGNACLLQGHTADAIQHWKAALKTQPDLPSAQVNLAWVLAACPDPSLRDTAAALALAQRANQLSGGRNPTVLKALAAAYADNGQFPDAVATAQRALQIAASQGNQRIAYSLQSQLKCYQINQPFRDPSLAPRNP
jgi:tetratricopeptide (TPR) repeat protein